MSGIKMMDRRRVSGEKVTFNGHRKRSRFLTPAEEIGCFLVGNWRGQRCGLEQSLTLSFKCISYYFGNPKMIKTNSLQSNQPLNEGFDLKFHQKSIFDFQNLF